MRRDYCTSEQRKVREFGRFPRKSARSHAMARRSVRLAFAAAVVLPGLDVAALDSSARFSCAPHELSEPPHAKPPEATPAKVVAKEEPAPAPVAPPAPPSPKEVLKTWLTARLPAGGELVEDGPGFSVTHTVK
jgi:hypothetical protein